MTFVREKGSETPACVCPSDEERAEDCTVHGVDSTRRETAAANLRELGS